MRSFTGILNSPFSNFTKISYSSLDISCSNLFFLQCHVSVVLPKRQYKRKKNYYDGHILLKKTLIQLINFLLNFRIHRDTKLILLVIMQVLSLFYLKSTLCNSNSKKFESKEFYHEYYNFLFYLVFVHLIHFYTMKEWESEKKGFYEAFHRAVLFLSTFFKVSFSRYLYTNYKRIRHKSLLKL